MLDYTTTIIYSLIIHTFSVSAMFLVRKYYKLKYKGYNDFIVYLILSLAAILLKYYSNGGASVVIIMAGWLTFVMSKFFLLRGFLSFLTERFSIRLYLLFVLIITVIIHLTAVLGLDPVYYITVVLLYNFLVHLFIFVRVHLSYRKIKHGRGIILLLNLLFMVKFISLIVVAIRSHNLGYADEFYFTFETMQNNLFSGFMFITILILYLDIIYKRTLQSRDRLEMASTISNTGYWELNLETLEVTASSIAHEMFGVDKAVERMSLSDIQRMIIKEDRRKARTAMLDLINKAIPFDLTYRVLTTSGAIKYVHSKAEVKHYNGSPNLVIGVTVDITDMKEREEILTHISYNDSLTGLYNRRYYEETIEKLNDGSHYPLSIMVIDINGLKELNDTFGHETGDKLLVATSDLLRSYLNKGDFVARIGGDEFVFVMPKTTYDDAQERARDILDSCKDYVVQGKELSLSLGLATKITHTVDFNIVFNDAESDMYSMKLIIRSSMRGSTIHTVLNTLHEKDQYSEQHSKVVSELGFQLADRLGLPLSQRNNVKMAGILHDIGKIIISDDILTKKGKLTDSEYEEIKQHSEFGYRILNATSDLRHLSEIVLHHHERYDGKGYPSGLRAEEIPLLSRIISIVDSYDAMTSVRTYKDRLTKNEAIEELERCKGTQFDPHITDIFINKVLKSS